uniref:ATP synthase complex subunit 8 n=1 Tax=Dicyphus sp. TaxID=2931289 RepID=A0A8T9ZXZ0_9HEMI|nr:ATPase subunit 8 [Dicyphus sp.]
MPQMSPMWWTTMFYVFITIFMMFIIMMYFNYEMKILNKTSIKKKMTQNPWKW